MSPPENTVQDIGGPGAQPPTGEQAAEGAADGGLGFRAVAALGHPESVGQQRGRHESADHTHDDYCVGVFGSGRSLKRRGCTTQRRTAAQASTTNNTAARISR